MEKLIKRAFKELLNLDVIVIQIVEEDIDFGIFIKENVKNISERDLVEYSIDYGISKTDNEKWFYIKAINHNAIIRNGECISPPDVEYSESVIVFDNKEKALENLILSVISDGFDDLLLINEEMNEI